MDAIALIPALHVHQSDVMWCRMPGGKNVARKPDVKSSTRTSVTLPTRVYSSLEIIAKKKKVSLAWVIRDAAEKYVAEQWPLFAGMNHEHE